MNVKVDRYAGITHPLFSLSLAYSVLLVRDREGIRFREYYISLTAQSAGVSTRVQSEDRLAGNSSP